ncbi:MAG: tail fiber domain-containing protein [Bacteroidia bacterium]
MKASIKIKITILFFFVCLTQIFQVSIAQAQWALGGNNGTNPPTDFLGTIDNVRLAIKTNSTERMTVAGGGNVGIGTTSPSSLLHLKSTSASDVFTEYANSNTTNNFFVGVDGSTGNALLRHKDGNAILFYTNNSERMRIRSSGEVGIGITTARSLLHQDATNETFHQFTNNTTGNSANTDGFKIGIASGGDAELRQQETGVHILFYTNISGSIAERMRIKNDGNVGIGEATPDYKLEVGGGDINVGVGSYSQVYRINTNEALAMPFGPTNICVGNNAGAVISADNNSTFVGANAGQATTSGSNNIAVGYNALTTNITGSSNTAIGHSALVNTTGNNNIAIGYSTLQDNTTGYQNIAIGTSALGDNNDTNNIAIGNLSLRQNTSGENNTAMGNNTLFYNTTGIQNTALGALAGDEGNLGGTYTKCTFLGYNADEVTASNLDNATAVGANSQVNCSDCMVLGSSASGGFNQVRVGIGYPNPTTASTDQFLLYVNSIACAGCPTSFGSGFFNGNIYAAGTFSPSDAFLKNNIQPLQSGIAADILGDLPPQTYDFNQIDNPQLNLPTGLQYGLMAEDVEAVLPGLVRTITTPAMIDSVGDEIHPELTFKAVNYTGLIPLMLAVINDQGAKISSLEQQMSTTPRNQNPTSNTGSIELENLKSLQLLQNDPNPFSESTMIRWSIPEDFNDAVIYFYNNSGNQINTYKINEKGAGELQVFGSKLSNGIYTYTLVVDGKVIDSKKMVKAK